jgi:hypothetical protein
MRPLALAALLLLTACSFRERIGEFDYDCQRGGGLFDGNFCEARLDQHFFLQVVEGGDGPYLQYRANPGAYENAGAIDPAFGEDMPIIARAGIDARYLVVETDAGRWYLHRIGAHAPGMTWPLMEGPFTREEFDARFAALQLPPMRQTR